MPKAIRGSLVPPQDRLSPPLLLRKPRRDFLYSSRLLPILPTSCFEYSEPAPVQFEQYLVSVAPASRQVLNGTTTDYILPFMSPAGMAYEYEPLVDPSETGDSGIRVAALQPSLSSHAELQIELIIRPRWVSALITTQVLGS